MVKIRDNKDKINSGNATGWIVSITKSFDIVSLIPKFTMPKDATTSMIMSGKHKFNKIRKLFLKKNNALKS